MAAKTTLLAVIAAIYGVIGTICLMWPEWLQAVAIRKSEAAKVRHAFVTRLVGSPHYVLYLQIVGAVSASAAVAITLFLLERVRHSA
jgi:hypothetical protein